MDSPRREALLAEYKEVRSDFRVLTDIRFKLLALLPIASGVVAALHPDADGGAALALYAFGLIITLCLVTYNERNDQLYNELVGRAAQLERALGLPDGGFANRPGPWLTLPLPLCSWKVSHSPSIRSIYAASAGLWLFGLLNILFTKINELWLASAAPRWHVTDAHAATTVTAMIVAVSLVVATVKYVSASIKARDDEMRDLARTLGENASRQPLSMLVSDNSFVKDCAQLSGSVPVDRIGRGLKFYANCFPGLDQYLPSASDALRGAHVIGLLTQLSPRWIYDCMTNRPGYSKEKSSEDL